MATAEGVGEGREEVVGEGGALVGCHLLEFVEELVEIEDPGLEEWIVSCV